MGITTVMHVSFYELIPFFARDIPRYVPRRWIFLQIYSITFFLVSLSLSFSFLTNK